MLECVVNISEGRDASLLHALGRACATSLLDVHTDAHHHRSVFTLGGVTVERDVRRLTEAAVRSLDLRDHEGVHPRRGVVDVVPFVPVPGTATSLRDAVDARDRFAHWIAEALDIPCFLYGSERSLPDIRREAFRTLQPDIGPADPHPSAGACAVGAREVLVAYNLWLRDDSVERARAIAKRIRSEQLRALGLDVGGIAQVSCNLVMPHLLGPDRAFDAVGAHAVIDHAELVGLVPEQVLRAIPRDRWPELDLGPDKTIEARLADASGPQPGED